MSASGCSVSSGSTLCKQPANCCHSAPATSAGQQTNIDYELRSHQDDEQQATRDTQVRGHEHKPTTLADNKRQQANAGDLKYNGGGPQAPLASLDLSIGQGQWAEVAGQAKQQCGQPSPTQTSSTFETPTLSGYFDCDELSDMVDDSLFELTAAGCLSRSLFGTSSCNEAAAAAASHQTSSGGRKVNSRAWTQSDGHHTEQPEEVGRQRTPTNELLEGSGGQPQAEGALRSEAHNSKVSPNAPEAILMRSIRQPHDYSGASSVPSQIRGSYQCAAEQSRLSAGQHQRHSAEAAAHNSIGSSGKKMPLTSTVAAQPLAKATKAATATSAPPPQPLRRRSKARQTDAADCSKSDLAKQRQQQQLRAKQCREHSVSSSSNGSSSSPPSTCSKLANEQLDCATCREQLAHTKAATKKANKHRKPRHRLAGAFSGLLNLFTGAEGHHSGHNGDESAATASTSNTSEARNTIKYCSQHMKHHQLGLLADRNPMATVKTASNEPTNLAIQRRASGAPIRAQATSLASTTTTTTTARRRLPPSRVRDSIRVTNQRKLRNNSRNHLSDSKGSLATSTAACRPIVNSIENIGHENNEKEVLLDLTRAHAVRGAQTQQQQQRPVAASGASKCVKFTTPDRVMILSPPPLVNGRSTHYYHHLSHSSSSPSLAAKQRCQRQQQMAAANLANMQAPVPIIKRTPGQQVPKSSSYSQTDSNRGLDELLAHYEANTKLVAQINEKLQLTDTIASNLSVLDNGQPEALEAPEVEPKQNPDEPIGDT